ncbi:MAG TPA: hypothetical protein VND65_12745 [Candidatus Binatia bacterium]|nr:hypothetical protein [Candidatus Binatia bacterium]
MLPFILYFLTSVLTAIHLYSLLALALYGVPVSPLEGVALLGSLLMLIAAYISLFRPRIGAQTALIAALLLWSFYAPAIVHRLRSQNVKPAIHPHSSRPA